MSLGDREGGPVCGSVSQETCLYRVRRDQELLRINSAYLIL